MQVYVLVEDYGVHDGGITILGIYADEAVANAAKAKMPVVYFAEVRVETYPLLQAQLEYQI